MTDIRVTHIEISGQEDLNPAVRPRFVINREANLYIEVFFEDGHLTIRSSDHALAIMPVVANVVAVGIKRFR